MARNPGSRHDRLKRLTAAAALAGALVTSAACGEVEAPSNVAGSYQGTEQAVRTPEQLQSDAERASAKAKQVALLAINTLATDKHRSKATQTLNDGTTITSWTNRDGRTNDNYPGPEVHVIYDPRNGGSITTEQVQTVDRQVRQLTSVVSVSGVESTPDNIGELRDQAHFGSAYRVNASSGEDLGSIHITYNLPNNPASGVFRVDTEHAAWQSSDAVATELAYIDEAYNALASAA